MRNVNDSFYLMHIHFIGLNVKGNNFLMLFWVIVIWLIVRHHRKKKLEQSNVITVRIVNGDPMTSRPYASMLQAIGALTLLKQITGATSTRR